MKTKTASITYKELDKETAEKLDKMFQKKNSMIEVNPSKAILPTAFRLIGEDILKLPIHESDVWLCSYPRTGSTWAQEMVWLIGHDLDYEGAKALQQIRCPLVELTSIIIDNHPNWHEESIKGTSVDLVRYNIPHPRYVRSHLPWDILPSDLTREDNSVKAKIIYTARNPKDMCVSFYHYCTLVHYLKATFEEFCEIFLNGTGPFGPVWNHILGFWSRRDDPNVLFIKYEDMKRDLPSIIRKAAAFLDKQVTDEQIGKLCEHLSFKSMKNNPAVNLEPIIEKTNGKSYLEQTKLRFIRKGEIGDWKNHMSEEMSQRFDDWSSKHLEGTGLNFD
ncbi:luciferin sulfotransferase-like [Arctopsyche grandis]|uniref:luciferin sulfotransferase-like n=1 Tax=Arctopsyche grandis TaxID=121162 RepID=UPI00406D6833